MYVLVSFCYTIVWLYDKILNRKLGMYQHEEFKLSTNNLMISEIKECVVASFHCTIVRKYDEIFDLLLIY